MFLFNQQSIVPQYQVEEYNNDIELNNPYTGQKSLWAPDPDPHYPNPIVKPSTDINSIPSNFKPLPADIAVRVVEVP